MKTVRLEAQPAQGSKEDGNGSGMIVAPVRAHSSSDPALSGGVRYSLRELTALEAEFAALVDRLSAAAGELQSGRAPQAGLAAEVEASQWHFEFLRQGVARLAQSAGVSAGSATENSATLKDLRAVLNAVAEAEEQRRAFREALDRALDELAPVALLYHDGTPLASLTECKARAKQLMEEISQSEWPRLHEECQPLLERRHPFSRLLDLVRHGEQLNDEVWQEAEEAVSATFGKALALAASRGRLHFQGEASDMAQTTESCPSCGSELDPGSRFCGECGVPRGE